MKNWTQTKSAYKTRHNLKIYADPKRRLNALDAIERTFKSEFPELLKDQQVFANIQHMYFLKLYECLKGSTLSGAEKTVIAGLYKFCG